MKSLSLFSIALALANTVSAIPKHNARHEALHDKRAEAAALHKRDTVVYTEMVAMTECVTVTVTSTVSAGGVPTTIQPPSINTQPQTKIIGSQTIKDVVKGGVFHEKPVASLTTSSVPPPPPSVKTTSSVVVPSSSVVVAPPVSSSSSVPAPPASSSSTTLPTGSNIAQPTGSNVPPVATGSPGGSSNLYNLAMPPTKQDWTSDCTGSTCTGIASFYNGLTDSMCCGYSGMAGQDAVKRIAAVPANIMGTSSNANSAATFNQPVNGNCGRMISVTVKSTGAQTTVQVVDKCPGCKSEFGLDLSEAAYAALGVSQDQGVVEIEWEFM